MTLLKPIEKHTYNMDNHIQITKETLHEILRQTWNREISADDAFELLEDTLSEVERLRHLLTEASYRITDPAFVAEIEATLTNK